MIKINNKLGVNHTLNRKILRDPVACSLLMYFMLDHPGTEDDGSAVSIQELSDYLKYSSKIIKKRIDRLEEWGLITTWVPDFKGGARMPTVYEINFDSELFIKTPRKAEHKEPEENKEIIKEMIDKFTEINQRIHGQLYKPEDNTVRKKWEEGARKILTLKPAGEEFSMETYESIIEYLANQMHDYLQSGDKYKMQCRDLKNLVYRHPNQSNCKYVNAFNKMKEQETRNIIGKENNGRQGFNDQENNDFFAGDLW